MIDRSLVVAVLTVLNEQRDVACGIDENALFDEVNLRALAPVTTPQLRETMDLVERKAWAAQHRDVLHARRWKLLPRGQCAIDEMKGGL